MLDYKNHIRYHDIAFLYDELENTENATACRKRIGECIKANELDKNICMLVERSAGLRYFLLNGFHDNELISVNLDKDDCRFVLNGGFDAEEYCGSMYIQVAFTGVDSCSAKSVKDLTKVPLRCQHYYIDFLPDGKLMFYFTFCENSSKRYNPRVVQITCRDINISAAEV